MSYKVVGFAPTAALAQRVAQWLGHMPCLHVVADHRAACESPVLTLGLVGFDADEEYALRAVVSPIILGGIRWKLSSLPGADAWLVNGARTQLVNDDTLRVAGAAPGDAGTCFNLGDIDRPIAFADPLPPDFEPALRFSPGSPGSIHAVLARFVLWMRPVAARLCLASQLIALHGELVARSVYHVISRGRLIAVVDLCGDCGVLPNATIGDFSGAEWSVRPRAAAGVPEGFDRVSLSLLMWEYAARTTRDLLPERYRQGTIHYRRPPRLPHRLLDDHHLLLLRELAFGNRNFDFLQRRTGMQPDDLARHLAALYLVGSITTSPARARVRPPRRTEAARLRKPEMVQSDWPSHPVGLAPAGKVERHETAPVQLSA